MHSDETVAHLEEAHGALVALWFDVAHASPDLPFPPAASSHFERCFRALCLVCSDTHGAIDHGRDALRSAQVLGEILESAPDQITRLELLRIAASGLENARELLVASSDLNPPSPLPLRASLELPELQPALLSPLVPALPIESDPISAALSLPEPKPRPRSFEELERAISELKRPESPKKKSGEDRAPLDREKEQFPVGRPPGFAADPLPALTRDEWLRVNVEDILGDVVALVLQRSPQLGDAWHVVDFIEKRILANLDALRALGDGAYHALARAVEAALVVDAPLLAGVGLIAGSVGGRDVLSLWERRMMTADLDEDGWLFVAWALCLGPSPVVDSFARHLLGRADRKWRAFGIEVLGKRRRLRASEVEELLGGGLWACALPYVSVLELERRREWLHHLAARPDLSPRELTEVYRHMLLAGSPRALPWLRENFSSDASGERAVLLGMAGDRADAELLLDAFAQDPKPFLAEALGFAGLARAIPFLLSALSQEDEDLKSEAALALERMTAAGLFEEVPVAPEEVMDPEIDEPLPASSGPGLAVALSDPRDLPEEGSPDMMLLPARSEPTWRAYFEAHEASYHPERRYRIGRPVEPSALVSELEFSLRTPRDRRRIHEELVIRTGRRVEFDPGDWTAWQRAAISAWKGRISEVALPVGTWERARTVE